MTIGIAIVATFHVDIGANEASICYTERIYWRHGQLPH